MRFYDDDELDENASGIGELQNDEGQNGGGLGQKAMDKGAQMAKDKMKDKAKEKLAKDAAKKVAAKGSLGAALGPIIFWAGIIILAIIIIVGIIMFFITMPGMVMEKLKALGKAIADGLSSWFGSDDTEKIEEESIYASLNYLEEMGYDLKGFGFLTEYMTQEDLDAMDEDEKENGAVLDKDVGVIRDNDEKIIKASSDYITAYLISDNYVYTIANHNLVTGDRDAPWYQWLWDKVQAIGRHIADFFGGSLGEKWTRGLIYIYEEKDGVLGKRGNFYSDTGFLNFDDLKIDPAAKTLTIEKSGFWNSNNAMTYSLDGWTGRYGMPIDFLISVHIATMMPDLAYDMAETFETKINLLLHAVDGSNVEAAFNNDGDYISLQQLIDIFDAGWWDLGVVSNADAKKVLNQLGIPRPSTCTGNEDKCAGSGGGGACGECEKYVQNIRDALKSAIDKKFNYYIPYIESVTEHWYRDVYFVTKIGKSFVKTDYDYEALMKERWTAYERDENLDIKLYLINENGEYLDNISGLEDTTNVVPDDKFTQLYIYKGTKEQAEEQGLLVAKKAETQDYWESNGFIAYLEDLSWEKSEDGITSVGLWTAYTDDTEETTTDWERTFPEDNDDPAKSKIYTRINSSAGSTIKQVGEGQRIETNETIKKMFLANTYFRYDGNVETAEKITKIRQAISEDIGEDGIEYGPLNEIIDEDGDVRDYTDKILTPAGTFMNAYNADGTPVQIPETLANEYYRISDYSGQVTLNQDSLNAFSMLENTHTLDSDYIYRDFKELVVELGYFEKEELTDETPKVLQFLVPEVNSIGYPERTIDKRENEYGTMVHSNGDIVANVKNTLIAAIEAVLSEEEVVTPTEPVDPNNQTSTSVGQSKFDKLIESMNLDLKSNRFVSVGSGLGSPSSPRSLLSIDEWWEECDMMMDTFAEQEWEYKQGHNSSTRGSFEAARDGGESQHYTDCSEFASWALQKLGVLDEGDIFSSSLASESGLNNNSEIAQKMLDANAEVIVYGGNPIGNEDDLVPGDVIFYSHMESTGCGHVSIYYGDGKCYDAGSAYWLNKEEPIEYSSLLTRDCNCVVRFDLAGSKYSGYFGNEAVVSPVTGVLLEYGTYNPKDNPAIKHIDSISGEEYRVNVDLKYGPLLSQTSTQQTTQPTPGTTNPTPQQTEPFESQIVSDSVGYAKILVLDTEHYEILESTTTNSWTTDSLVTETGNYRDTLINDDQSTAKEKLKDLSNIDKTVYGYKEFAELYNTVGIAGYVVYIDGFVCEMPDSSLLEVDRSEMLAQIPDGVDINLDYYKRVTEDTIDTISQKKAKSYYIPEDRYKLASQNATDKLTVEIGVKKMAFSTLYTDDLIFIKEGTILGRTMTDRELIEEMREDQYGDFKENRPSCGEITLDPETGTYVTSPVVGDNQDKIIGNYLRIIMRDLDGTPVENVEDYMKLREAMKYNDFDVSDPSLFVTLDEFKVMFAGWENIYENAAAFIEMQEKYGVNAVFAAAVTLTESAGGTAWDLIDPSTYNWVSIKGGSVEAGTGYEDRLGNVWRVYDSFAHAIDSFGNLIAYSPHYFQKNRVWVSEIGPVYCEGNEWAGKVIKHMQTAYDKLYTTDY